MAVSALGLCAWAQAAQLAVARGALCPRLPSCDGFSSSPPRCACCAATLDDVLVHNGHVAEVALLSVLAPAAAGASPQQLEWLLQRIQLMLAALHQREAGGERAFLCQLSCVLAASASRECLREAACWHPCPFSCSVC